MLFSFLEDLLSLAIYLRMVYLNIWISWISILFRSLHRKGVFCERVQTKCIPSTICQLLCCIFWSQEELLVLYTKEWQLHAYNFSKVNQRILQDQNRLFKHFTRSRQLVSYLASSLYALFFFGDSVRALKEPAIQ